MIYTFAFVCYIVGAILLFLCLVLMGIGMTGTARAASLGRVRRWYQFTHVVSKVLPVGAALLLLSGFSLNVLRWGWRFGWTNVALASLLLVALVAPLVLNRRLAAIGDSLSDTQPVETVRWYARHPLLWWAWEILSSVSLGILYLMFTKPPLPVSMTIMVAAVVVSGVVALPFRRGRVARTEQRSS